MKNSTSILFALLLSASMIACKKEETPSNENALEDFTSLKVNGVYKEDITSGGGYISGSGNAAISGDFANGEAFYIYIDNAPAEDTYMLGAADDDCTYMDEAGVLYSLSNGSSYMNVTISDVQTNEVIKGVAGSFEGKLYNTAGDFVEITEGKFSDL